MSNDNKLRQRARKLRQQGNKWARKAESARTLSRCANRYRKAEKCFDLAHAMSKEAEKQSRYRAAAPWLV